MNLFDQLVTEAIKNQPDLATLKVVVEKELLHHDILRTLSENNLLKDLTFIGGTCLRACYGGIRLSEDLDFTGGLHFSREKLSQMGEILVAKLEEKYGLIVNVTDPIKDKNNVDTWKIRVETRPEQKDLPLQRINIDICRVPSYEKKPMMLINPYGVDMGTGGLIIQAQSREEIFSDKLLAFALRPNRIKHRDIWDIVWLNQQGYKPNISLIPKKLSDRKISNNSFHDLFRKRKELLVQDKSQQSEFRKEMLRFLPKNHINRTLEQNDFWLFITNFMEDLSKQMEKL